MTALRHLTDGTPVAGQQFGYLFDDIGNRKETQSGGDATGQNLRLANYSANNLNQITQRDVPAYVDVMGASVQPFNNPITVNGQTAYRKQEYFRAQIPANNSDSALWTNITVLGGQAVTGNVYVAEEPEHFQYDADGNLTNDGRWSYVWNGENRLIQMTVNTNVGPQYQLKFAYDYQGRRIQKIVLTNSVPEYTNDFVYDGWNLIGESGANNSLARYVWGTDVSGSEQGAGGVGGLLEVSDYGTQATNCFVAYDGNGNVMALVNAANGTLAAEYDYGPFGELIRQTGPMAQANPFRFSTKYQDDESDLLYYGYRYYKPSTGTWANRDPREEIGGLNLSAYTRNDSVDRTDTNGLEENDPPPSATSPGPPGPLPPPPSPGSPAPSPGSPAPSPGSPAPSPGRPTPPPGPAPNPPSALVWVFVPGSETENCSPCCTEPTEKTISFDGELSAELAGVGVKVHANIEQQLTVGCGQIAWLEAGLGFLYLPGPEPALIGTRVQVKKCPSSH